MNSKFLIMVATVCGLVMIAALLIFPLVTWGEGDASGSARAVEHPGSVGGFLLMFSWLAVAFAAFVFLKKTEVIGMSENMCRMLSLVGFKMTGFFCIALLIAGSGRGSFGIGYWLAFIASIVGAFAVYLTFNPDLAKKLAEAAKSDDEKPADDKPADA